MPYVSPNADKTNHIFDCEDTDDTEITDHTNSKNPENSAFEVISTTGDINYRSVRHLIQ